MRTPVRRTGDVMRLTTATALLLAAAACARAAQTPSSEPPEPVAAVADVMSANVELRDPAGAPVGTARLTGDEDGTIRLELHAQRLPPGTHGVHFHAVGSCQRGDSAAFYSAGGHHNPLSRKHGLENPEGPHAGDLPNLTVDASGVGHLDTQTARATLRAGPATLFDADGSALVVHAAEDDQKTDPSGNSGARIACGVVTKS
jgi:superoxide dismutase, Cu-Zn family